MEESNTIFNAENKTKVKIEVEIETKIEIRNRKNKMNIRSRKKNLYFSATSTFPYFLNTLKFYSPFIFNQLTDEECFYIIKKGFYNFVENKKENNENSIIELISTHELEFTKFYRQKIEMDLQLIFDSFLADLSAMTKLQLFSSGKPFAKRRERKKKQKFIKFNGFTLLE